MKAYQLILLTRYIPLEYTGTFMPIHGNIENWHEEMSYSSEYSLKKHGICRKFLNVGPIYVQ
jgi:hypothetical protein